MARMDPRQGRAAQPRSPNVDSGSGPVVLFIHGILGSQRQWAHLVDAMDEDHRALVPDLFGHGDSAKPPGDYSLSAHAASMRDLLDHLGIERVTLVGHSLGGGIAMQFFYLFPERVDRLVLVSSGGLGREVNLVLRSATLPGAAQVLSVIASAPVLGVSRPWVAVPRSWAGDPVRTSARSGAGSPPSATGRAGVRSWPPPAP